MSESRADPEDEIEYWRTAHDEERVLEELRRRLAWRKERRAGPKCLECGARGPFFVQVKERDEEDVISPLEHPGCGGTLSITPWPGFVNSHPWVFYTDEGDKIEAFIARCAGLVKVNEE